MTEDAKAIVTITKVTHDRLKKAADDRDLGMNVIADRAIARYLDQLPPVESLLP